MSRRDRISLAFYLAAALFTCLAVWCQGCAGSTGAYVRQRPAYETAVLLYKDPQGLCSAVGIEPRLALTARHCLDAWPQATLTGTDGQVWPVEAAAPAFGGEDIAVLRVPAGLPPLPTAPIASTLPVEGARVRVAGYGCPWRGELSVRGALYVGLFADGLGLQGVLCHGDSGGGTFNLSGELVGIHSRAGLDSRGDPVALDTPVGAALLSIQVLAP